MKKYKFLFSLLVALFNVTSFAQNLPDNTTAPAGSTTPPALPGGYTSGTPLNYVRTWVPQKSITDPNTIGLTSGWDVHLSTTYYNGFGQTIQHVAKHGTGVNLDYVQVYDNRPLGNTQYSYLPYAVSGNGKFHSSPYVEQKSFYDNLYPQEGSFSFSKSDYNSNATSRTSSTYQPGKSSAGLGNGISETSQLNIANEVIFWRYDNINDVPVNGGYYTAGRLIKKITSTANGGRTEVFLNNENRAVCTRTLSGYGACGSGCPIYQTTYPVYDNLGRQVFTITPKATDAIAANNGLVTQSILKELCAHTSYDINGRVFQTHTPGNSGNALIVYDKKNRPVLTQSPLQQVQGKWSFVLYDGRDRPTVSGILSDNTHSRSDFQNWFDGYQVPPGSLLTTGNWLYYAYSDAAEGQYPSSLSDGQILGINYYDNYNYTAVSGRTFDFSQFSGYLQTGTYAISPSASPKVNGKITCKKVRIMKDSSSSLSDWITSVFFYDASGNMIQQQSQNAKGAWDYYSNQVDFSDKVILTIVNHTNPSASKSNSVIATLYLYSVITDQLTDVKVKIDNQQWVTVENFTYDQLGRIATKSIGGVEQQNLKYNIRNQLASINGDYAEYGNATGNNTFGESLKYDYGFNEKRYDGNVSGIIWKGANGMPTRAYGYSYDQPGHLTQAEYREMSSVNGGLPSWNKQNTDFTVSNLSYDANGNILSMKQRGVTMQSVGGTYVTQVNDVDRLGYQYASGTNRLTQVTDSVTTNWGSVDFVDNNAGTPDYAYDANGNLIADANKGITSITYNHLDLPVSINFSGSNPIRSIQYTYDAGGNKLRESISNGSATVNIDYVGPFVYANDTLLCALHKEGRARFHATGANTMGWDFDYFIKDHLDNVRTILTAEQVPLTDYLATHEIAAANLENLVFSNIDSVRGEKPGSTDPSDTKAAVLDGSDPKRSIGTSLLLKVMAGDKFQLSVQNYYDAYSPEQDNPATGEQMLNSLLNVFANGMSGVESGEGTNMDIVNKILSPDNFLDAYSALQSQYTNNDYPKAYLNYIFFDENMRVVKEESGLIQVNGQGDWTTIGTPGMLTINHNGYMLAYISNASKGTVYFDKMELQFYKGKLLEENHYYPYGLPLTDGSNNPLVRRYLYQSKEWRDDLALMWYDFHARQYDPQIGRFASLDPANQFSSGYIGMGNNPVIGVDKDGKFWQYVIGAVIGGAVNLYQNWGNVHGFWNGAAYFGLGAVNGACIASGNSGLMALGGGIQAAGNTALGGGSADKIVTNGLWGAATSWAGGQIMGGVNQLNPGKFLTGNPMMQNILTGGISMGLANSITGGISTFQQTGSMRSAANSALTGLVSGMVMGGITGGIQGYQNLKDANRNPATGQPNQPQIQPLQPIESKTFTYDENLARTDLKPEWTLGACPRGKVIETIYANSDYAGWTHTPYAKTVDFTSPDGSIVVSMKSTMSETLNVTKNITELGKMPATERILHIVVPPGHVPANLGAIQKQCSLNFIELIVTEH